MSPAPPPATTPSGPGFWIPTGLALALHLGIGFVYYSSGLVAPGWAVVLLVVVWLGLTALWVASVRRRSWWNLAVPVVEIAIWFAVITLGERLLGWTA